MTIVAPTPHTPMPTAPDPNDRATFDSRAYAFNAAQELFGDQMDALADAAYQNALDAQASATLAATKRDESVSAATTSATKRDESVAAAAAAAVSRDEAAASAVAAAAIAGAFVGTSTSSVTIGTGSKTFTTQTGEQYSAGVFLTAVRAADPSCWMFGQVTSYSGSTLILDVQATNGSGTFTDWNLSLTGARGATGPAGAGVTEQAVGFTLTGGASAKTLTVTRSVDTATILDEAPAVTLASSATLNVGTASANTINVTGATTITSLGTAAEGVTRRLLFAGALTLTHNATSLILPGAANITTAAGDVAVLRSLGFGNWKCLQYQKADGTPITSPGGQEQTFTADGAITQGKAVILKSNGKVAQSLIAVASAGSAANLSGSNASAISTCYDPVNDKFLVFYCDTSDGSKGKVVVGTVSGNGVTFGAPVVFFNAALYTASINGIDSCYDEDTGQIVVAYIDGAGTIGRLRTCAVSGTTVSFGAELSTSLVTYALGVCYDTSVNRVLFAHRDGATQKAAVISVSGTSLILGATGTAVGSGVDGYASSVVHCQGYSSAGYNVICYNTGGQAYIIQARIDPSTFTLSFVGGAPANFGGSDGYVYGKSLAWSSAYQRLVVLQGRGPSYSYSLSLSVYSISGATFTGVVRADIDTSGSFSAPYQNFPALACSPDGTSVVVTWPDQGSTYYGKIRFSTSFSASSISFGGELQYQTNDVGWTSVAYNNEGKVVVGYSITTGLGKSVVVLADVPDQRTSFIGFAKATVANGQPVTVTIPMGVDANQSGLTPNTNYFLSSTDGSTLTTTVNGPRVGKALSATKLLVLGSNVYQV